MPPSKCSVTIAGNNFIVTVRAPKAPCRQTQNSVTIGQNTDTWIRCRSRQLKNASTRMSTPTPVAR